MAQYQADVNGLKKTLERRGVQFGKEKYRGKMYPVADASKLLAAGIDTLGKLDYLKKTHIVYLPVDTRRKDLDVRIH